MPSYIMFFVVLHYYVLYYNNNNNTIRKHLEYYYYYYNEKAACLTELLYEMNIFFLSTRVNEITDFEKVAQDTDCLYRFILKGVSVAIFYLGRCFERGAGIRKSLENAQKCYLKVS